MKATTFALISAAVVVGVAGALAATSLPDVRRPTPRELAREVTPRMVEPRLESLSDDSPADKPGFAIRQQASSYTTYPDPTGYTDQLGQPLLNDTPGRAPRYWHGPDIYSIDRYFQQTGRNWWQDYGWSVSLPLVRFP